MRVVTGALVASLAIVLGGCVVTTPAQPDRVVVQTAPAEPSTVVVQPPPPVVVPVP